MAAITRRQRDLIDFIMSFVATNHYSPSFEEIAKGLGLKSIATVHKHISHLKAKGLLTSNPNKARSIEVVPQLSLMKDRFEFHGSQRLWDTIDLCYWVRQNSRDVV